MIKYIFKILFIIFLIAICTKSWITYSCSFRIDKIEPKDFFENANFYKSEISNLEKIFNQNFKFINKGRHTFVFLSEDNNYVVKFFRFHRYKLPFVLQVCKSFPMIKKISKKIQKELDILYFETINSYKLAYENLQTQTATIYVHLNKSNDLNKKIKILDKFNVSYYLDLDNYGFIIQKKAKSFQKELLKLKNDKLAVESLLNSFFDNLGSIYEKNIINNDRHILNNLGIIDNKIIEIDIGRFALNKQIKEKTVLEKEAYHYTVYLRKWLSKNIPDALPVLDSQLKNIINLNSNETN